MSLFKTNRDLDSTLIIFGIHMLLGGVLALDYFGKDSTDLSSMLNNLLIIYGMICSYFFKSQSQKEAVPVAVPQQEK